MNKENPLGPALETALQKAYQSRQKIDIEAAIELIQEALSAKPSDPELHHYLANLYKQNAQKKEAQSHYRQTLALAPNNPEALTHLAGLYAEEGDYIQALRHYKQALDIAPDFVVAHYNLALLFLKKQEIDAAYVQFNNVLALFPEHLGSQFYRAVLDLEAGRFPQAEQGFKALLEADPTHVDALTNLGVVYLKEQQEQMAIDCFSKALTFDNAHIEARNNIAATFMHFDRFENALMHYDVLLEKDPNNIEYLYNSGVAQMALGHLKEAIGFFERILVQEEENFAALNNLAAIFMRLEDKAKARSLLERAIQANPKDPVSRHMLAAFASDSQKDSKRPDTCTEYAKNLFNNYALYYDEHLRKYLHYSLPQHLLRLLDILSLKTIPKALDLGCGTGLSGEILRDYSKILQGVDISAKMLAIAKAKGIYDQLTEDDLLPFLKKNKEKYALILALDVFPYFGDLGPLFAEIAKHLDPQGYFIFSSEISKEGPWQLQSSARFAHQKDYLLHLSESVGFKMVHCQEVMARQQEGEDLSVFLIVLQKN